MIYSNHLLAFSCIVQLYVHAGWTSNELSHAATHKRLFSYIWQQLLQLNCAGPG